MSQLKYRDNMVFLIKVISETVKELLPQCQDNGQEYSHPIKKLSLLFLPYNDLYPN
jgi:hypothetical protein